MNRQRTYVQVPILCCINEEDIKGFYVNVGDRRVRIDKYGIDLYKKYKWIINYSYYYPHRWDCNHNLIAFHREILQLHNTSNVVKFINGNSLDCRLANLECSVFWKMYTA